MNLRARTACRTATTFGQFLGSLRVSHPVPAGITLETLARDVHAETRASSATSCTCRHCSRCARRGDRRPLLDAGAAVRASTPRPIRSAPASRRSTSTRCGRGTTRPRRTPVYIRGVPTGPLAPLVWRSRRRRASCAPACRIARRRSRATTSINFWTGLSDRVSAPPMTLRLACTLARCSSPRPARSSGCATHAAAPAAAARRTPAPSPRAVTLDRAPRTASSRSIPTHVTRRRRAAGPLANAPDAARSCCCTAASIRCTCIMVSFGHFLVGWAIRKTRIRDPGTARLVVQPVRGRASASPGIVAWHYEHDGMRPMMIGHSQGGMQAVKVLQELDGALRQGRCPCSIRGRRRVEDAHDDRRSAHAARRGRCVGLSASLRVGGRRRRRGVPAAQPVGHDRQAAHDSRHRRRVHRLLSSRST